MVKYVLLFCALLGVFLMSGFESVSGGMKEHKALCTIDLQQAETQCTSLKQIRSSVERLFMEESILIEPLVT